MATYQLGPEIPDTFSVLSEMYLRRRMDLPKVAERDRFSFGPLYERKLCETIYNYLDLRTDDRVCYVGHERGNLARALQRDYCLIEPITVVTLENARQERPSERSQATTKSASCTIVDYFGADEYFRKLTGKDECHEERRVFDKILFVDCISNLENPDKCLENATLALAPSKGRIMIVHRAAAINTLPIFTDVQRHLEEKEDKTNCSKLIEGFRSCRLIVRWEIESVPIILPKLRWLSMMNDRYPPMLEVATNTELSTGIRELSEGILKYEGNEVEFVDRLLFIVASRETRDVSKSDMKIKVVAKTAKKDGGFLMYLSKKYKYQMEITPDIRNLMRDT